jgi:DNA-directed RNA polymerase beta subunit
MERDGLLSHGATSCQKEKTFDHSDAYRTLFCKNCGTIANVKKITLRNPCQGCSKEDFGMVSIPYSYKVLVHELSAASMQISLRLKEKSKILL